MDHKVIITTKKQCTLAVESRNVINVFSRKSQDFMYMYDQQTSSKRQTGKHSRYIIYNYNTCSSKTLLLLGIWIHPF